MDDAWDGEGIPTSDWEGELGDHDFEGLPEPIARLTATLDRRTYDLSGMGPGGDVGLDERHPIDLDTRVVRETPPHIGEVRVVKDLGPGFFRSKLMEHFDILWRRGEIEWPTRRGPSPA